MFDVISQEMTNEQLVIRNDIKDFNVKSQLIVHESQEAIFFKNGQALDTFGPGAHSLKSENVPLIRNIISKFFKGDTPFPCEVYFVNKVMMLSCKWGTRSNFFVHDSKFDEDVEVGALGQTDWRIENAHKFIKYIAGQANVEGNNGVYTKDILERHIVGHIQTDLQTSIAQAFEEQNINVFAVTKNLVEISARAQEILNKEIVDKWGIRFIDFKIARLQPTEEYKALNTARHEIHLKTNEALAEAAAKKVHGFADVDIAAYELERMNVDYATKRQLDVLQTAAQNEGAAGGFINMGVGMGVGVGMARQVGDMTNNMYPQTPATPQAPAAPQVPAATGTKKCVSCGADIPSAAKFCSNCGTPQPAGPRFCTQCGAACSPESKFCPECGNKLG